MKEDLLKYLKKNWKIIAAAIFVPPILIHIAFKIAVPVSFLVPKWTAGDVLSFYGVILGACATVFGVYLSIKHSENNFRADTFNRARPFIAITPVITEVHTNGVDSLLTKRIQTKPKYKEYILDRVAFVLENGKVSARSQLNDHQESLKQSRQIRVVDKDGIVIACTPEVVTATFIAENVGVGVANRLLVGFNRTTFNHPLRTMTLIKPLKIGDRLTIDLYIEKPNTADYCDYELTFEYQDIYENTYVQCFPVNLDRDETGSFFFLSADGEQKQILNQPQ